MPRINHFAIRLLPALACLLVCICGYAQDESDPYPMPPRTVESSPLPTPPAPKPATSPAPASAPKPAATPAPQPAKPSPGVAAPAPKPVPPSLLNQPAQAPKINLASGKLTIEAHNSSLSDILSQIARAGGMKIDGLNTATAQRVFGKYGPGAPREVLSDLLTGSGYNVLMMGVTPSGTPRQLTLSVRAAGGVPNPPPHPANQDEENDEDIQPTQYPDEQDQQQETQPQQQPQQPQPPPSNNLQENRVRTPQQILQELQRMREQQQQREPR